MAAEEQKGVTGEGAELTQGQGQPTGDAAGVDEAAVEQAATQAPEQAAPVEPLNQLSDEAADAAIDQKKVPTVLRMFGGFMIAWGVFELLMMFAVVGLIVAVFALGIDLSELAPNAHFQKPILALAVAIIIDSFAIGVLDFLLGVNLVKNKRARSARRARVIMFLLVVQLFLEILGSGVTGSLNFTGLSIAFMVVLQIVLDPSLVEERALDRKLRKLDARSREEERLEHLRKYGGKAPFKLTFFNLFWTFVICSVLGVIVETIYCLVVGAGYMDRAGLLYGPFSPIYGFGAVMMTMGLNGIRDKNPVIIFLLSAVIGGAFEFLVSLFLEYCFGITAWDYTGTFLSIDGRTNGFFMAAWGALGLVWVKFLMPAIFDLVHKIPWNWRYAVTGVAVVLMLMDGGLTLVSYDRWYSRQVGIPADTAIEQFCDENYPDEWMANRFQTMTMNASNAGR